MDQPIKSQSFWPTMQIVDKGGSSVEISVGDEQRGQVHLHRDKDEVPKYVEAFLSGNHRLHGIS